VYEQVAQSEDDNVDNVSNILDQDESSKKTCIVSILIAQHTIDLSLQPCIETEELIEIMEDDH